MPPVSTVSQPSMVARMMALLGLRPGMRVLELGTGSGWSSAMMSHLVGAEGRVVTTEIESGLAAEASARLAERAADVTVIAGDGREVGRELGPYARIVLTASAPEISSALVAQLAPGGVLLTVLALDPDLHLLVGLERHGTELRSVRPPLLCRFVPLRGSGQPESGPWTDPLQPDGRAAHAGQISFGTDEVGEGAWCALAFRLFVRLSRPTAYRRSRGRAWSVVVGGSTATIEGGRVSTTGGPKSSALLRELLAEWARFGMPAASAWSLLAKQESDATAGMGRGGHVLTWSLAPPLSG